MRECRGGRGLQSWTSLARRWAESDHSDRLLLIVVLPTGSGFTGLFLAVSALTPPKRLDGPL